jgi:hypothetical protein
MDSSLRGRDIYKQSAGNFPEEVIKHRIMSRKKTNNRSYEENFFHTLFSPEKRKTPKEAMSKTIPTPLDLSKRVH